MDNTEIQQHVAGTYRSLRFGLGAVSFAFPLFLLFVGMLWYGVAPQDSISAYYFAEPSGAGPIKDVLGQIDAFPIKQLLFFLDQLDSEAPLRSWFVGTLFVLGVFLYLYKGFSHGENWLLNAAGLFALGVALFPTGWSCDSNCPPVTLHGICAVAAFVCLTLVSILCAKQTLALPGLAPQRQKLYRRLYNATGVAMVVFPIVALVVTWLFGATSKVIFWAEAFGLWAFSAYWLVKSMEMDENRAETRALEAALETSSTPVMKEVPAFKELAYAPKSQPTGATRNGSSPAHTEPVPDGMR